MRHGGEGGEGGRLSLWQTSGRLYGRVTDNGPGLARPDSQGHHAVPAARLGVQPFLMQITPSGTP
ncbi:hypothetical protein AB0H88_18840 [Nonomuraea sp. NPDC050680]|uniref:hypothetical protein n=1 Tax=Nonomuraea sp. NPDC050680 TaxID=3154630 RepID=UPI0033F69446